MLRVPLWVEGRIELSVVICNAIFIDDPLHILYELPEFLIKVLRVIWVFRRGVIMYASRVSWVVSVSIPLACFRFPLSCFFLSYSPFSLECLKDCFGSWEFYPKFSRCFFDCDFTWDDSLDKLLANFLRYHGVFFLLRANIFLRFIHITTSTAERTLVTIAWHALWI